MSISQERLEKLWKSYHSRIVGLAYKSIHHVEDSQDIASEAWCKVVKACNDGIVRDETHLSVFLFSVTKRCIVDYCRKRDRDRKIISRAKEEAGEYQGY